MKKFVLLLVAAILVIGSFAQAIEECHAGAKPLYKDIQIYNQTEKIMPQEGLIGERLEMDLSRITYNGSLKEKVQMLETGFAKCDVNLNSDDELEIALAVEAILKMKNPLLAE